MQGLVMAAVLTLAVGAHTDTTLTVSSGTQLELENYAGSIEVSTWSRNAVRIEAEHGRRSEVEVSRDESTLSVSVESSRGTPTSADFKLTVPTWMALKLSGVYCDISVTGTRGTVEAETVQGDVEVTGGEGHLSVQSVQGSVRVTGASGKIEASSVNEGVDLERVSGEVTAESVNGKVEVRQARLSSLEASTVNGTLIYDGSFEKSGRYELSTHNGSVYVAIPANADLNVEATTYSGSLSSTFPIEKDREAKSRTKRYSLHLGSGSAELTVETFQGTIVLHRPGEKVIDAATADDKEVEKAIEKALEKEHGKVKIKLPSKPGKNDDQDSEDEDR